MKLFFKCLLFFFVVPMLLSCQESKAQTKKGPSSFEILYDEPYAINRLFIHFQPVIADVFLTNPNVSFGFEANYLPGKKLNYEISIRKAYGRATDVMRDLAETNKTNQNETRPFRWIQAGATYHIKDRERDGNARIVPYTKKTKAHSFDNYNYFEVPCLVREIIGVRAGAYNYQTTIDVSNNMIRQGIKLTSQEGNPLTLSTKERIYSNMMVSGFYLGGSFTTIRNVVVKPEGGSGVAYKNSGSDQILTAYADLMYSPFINLEQVKDGNQLYDLDPMKTNALGWRIGLDVMHNRAKHWSFNIEMGSHTGLSRRAGFFTAKIAFPVMAFTIDKKLNK
jgi:hypothetical protein